MPNCLPIPVEEGVDGVFADIGSTQWPLVWEGRWGFFQLYPNDVHIWMVCLSCADIFYGFTASLHGSRYMYVWWCTYMRGEGGEAVGGWLRCSSSVKKCYWCYWQKPLWDWLLPIMVQSTGGLNYVFVLFSAPTCACVPTPLWTLLLPPLIFWPHASI